MMRATPWVIFALVCVSASAAAQTTDMYTGRWKMTSMRIDVAVESWGENCGPRPRSYSSNRTQTVDVYSRGKHLIFSKGGLRTDRCWSPNNPRIETLTSSASPGRWERVCQTRKNDPKFERGEYTLTAIDSDTLAYLAISKFEWTLKGDHCIARLVEKRRYIRQGAREENTAASERTEPPDEMDIETDPGEVFPDEGCSPSGPVKRITMTPETATLKPGDKVCFKVFGFDANDCRHRLDVFYRVTQDGRPVPGLIKANGCFVAGQTAAESEGVYEVTGRIGNRKATSQVEVVFPDLGELIAARLSPLEDLEANSDEEIREDSEPAAASPDSVQKASGTAVTVPGDISATIKTETEDSPTALIVTVAVGALFAGGFALVFLVLRRRRAEIGDEEDLDNWPSDIPPSSTRHSSPKSPSSSRSASSAPVGERDSGTQWLVCPTCGEEFKGQAKFCPHDRTPLVSAAERVRPSRGMVCPFCHRGYEADARFCPHDSAALVSYDHWRAHQRKS